MGCYVMFRQGSVRGLASSTLAENRQTDDHRELLALYPEQSLFLRGFCVMATTVLKCQPVYCAFGGDAGAFSWFTLR